jgi:hypothetical protein
MEGYRAGFQLASNTTTGVTISFIGIHNPAGSASTVVTGTILGNQNQAGVTYNYSIAGGDFLPFSGRWITNSGVIVVLK